MPYILFAIAAFMVLGTCLIVANVGKPRQPITGRNAATSVLLNGGFITALVIAGLALLHR